MIGTLLLPESILSSEEFPLKGCKITGTCAFRVHTKHDQTLFDCLFSSSLLPISVATNWLDLLRFANREPFQTQLSATYPDGMLQLKSTIKHIHSIWVHPRLHLMACWHILYNTWTTVEVGEWDSTEHRKREEEEDLSGVTLLAHELTDILAQRVKPKKLKRGIQRRIPPSLCSPSRSSPLTPPQPSADQHMWWRMTHLFFYKGCVYVKLLKCIKMSSTLGGPPRLPWKITRWKYNFSAGEQGIWTEICLSLSLALFFSLSLYALLCSLFLFSFFFCMLFFFYFTWFILFSNLLWVHTVQ